MSVQLTTAKLFELLGSTYAEARVLAEENARLLMENGTLKAAIPPPAAEEEQKPKRKAS